MELEFPRAKRQLQRITYELRINYELRQRMRNRTTIAFAPTPSVTIYMHSSRIQYYVLLL